MFIPAGPVCFLHAVVTSVHLNRPPYKSGLILCHSLIIGAIPKSLQFPGRVRGSFLRLTFSAQKLRGLPPLPPNTNPLLVALVQKCQVRPNQIREDKSIEGKSNSLHLAILKHKGYSVIIPRWLKSFQSFYKYATPFIYQVLRFRNQENPESVLKELGLLVQTTGDQETTSQGDRLKSKWAQDF